MLSRRGVTPIIAILLLLMMTIVVSGSTFYWYMGIQSSSQEKSLAYERATITQILTEADVAIKPDYSSAEEVLMLNLSDLIIELENNGKVPIDLGGGDIFIQIEDGNNDKICVSDTTAACERTESYIFAGERPDPALLPESAYSGSNIYYTPNGSQWVTTSTPLASSTTAASNFSMTDEAVNMYVSTRDVTGGVPSDGEVIWSEYGTEWESTPNTTGFSFNDLEVYNGSLYMAGENTTGSPTNGVILQSNNSINWSVIRTFTEPRVLTLKSYENMLFAGTGDGLGNGKIYSTGNLSGWSSETIAVSVNAITELHEFNGTLYAGAGNTVGAVVAGSGYILYRNTAASWNKNYSGSEIAANVNISDFAGLGGELYATGYNATNNDANQGGILYKYSADTWSIVTYENTNPFISVAASGDYLYVGKTGTVDRSPNMTEWETVVSTSGWVNFLDSFDKCTERKIKCIYGCDTSLQPGEKRQLKFSLEDTVCDISRYGPASDYIITITVGRDFRATFYFTKDQKVATTGVVGEDWQ